MKKQTNVNWKEYGAYLLTRPFNEWFLVMFKAVETKTFINDNLHNKIFDLFQDIFLQKKDVQNICLNQPPRSAKTTICLYFMVYSILQNECRFIYTTYSNQLLKDARNKIEQIVNSNAFDSFYGKQAFVYEEEKAEFDDLYFEQLNQNINYSKIKFGKSEIYLSPLGNTTGIGAGIFNAEKYSGSIIMDDINKVTDTMTNKTLNNKIKDYFSTNILTRINNQSVSILNIQQRISVNDMSDYLISKYSFKQVKMPLINDDGSCNLTSQYSPDRINLLKIQHQTWMAQYQQEPIEEIMTYFAGQMFDYDTVQNSVKRHLPYEINPIKILGIDPKREGCDTFNIVLRIGKYAKILFDNNKTFSTQEAVDVIVNFINKHVPDEIYIDSGKGEGIIDSLHNLNYYNVFEIKFKGESHRSDCINKRAAMFADGRDWLNAGGVLPDDVELKNQLCSIGMIEDESNIIKLEPKKNIIARLGKSPGKADAWALTFASRRNLQQNQKEALQHSAINSYLAKIHEQNNYLQEQNIRSISARIRR